MSASVHTVCQAVEPLSETCNILVSSAGRRVSLVRCFRESLADLGLRGRVFAADLTPASSAYQEADAGFPAPLFASGEFIPEMLRVCQKHEVRLLIPTIDTELELLAAHRADFAAIGTTLAISGPEAVRIGCDKSRTHAWLLAQGWPTPAQATPEEVLADPTSWGSPLIVKPRFGSSAIGFRRLDGIDELAHLDAGQEMIVQELASGVEYTVDVYVDHEQQARCSVPRLRIETRAGEVSKAVTVRSKPIQHLARNICEALDEPCGVFNVQVFSDEDTGVLKVIEFNPRFGGGYPLTHRAGARFTTWLIEETLGLPCTAREDEWRDGLVMLRYDEAIFVSREQAGL